MLLTISVNAFEEECAKVEEAQRNWENAAKSVSGNIDSDTEAARPVMLGN